jgi:hypothetical protein
MGNVAERCSDEVLVRMASLGRPPLHPTSASVWPGLVGVPLSQQIHSSNRQSAYCRTKCSAKLNYSRYHKKLHLCTTAATPLNSAWQNTTGPNARAVSEQGGRTPTWTTHLITSELDSLLCAPCFINLHFKKHFLLRYIKGMYHFRTIQKFAVFLERARVYISRHILEIL